MKRIHLFEFEDLTWFPNWLRIRMTRYLNAIHKVMGTSETLAELLARVLKDTNQTEIIDMCSGGGGPMPEVQKILQNKYQIKTKLTLTDLYPNKEVAKEINSLNNPNIEYSLIPVDVTNIENDKKGLRTMICSMHHMTPNIAKDILTNSKDKKQPICIYEISDNSFPKVIWWIAIPTTFISVFFMTFMVRPLTWQQIIFTYFLPILPLFIAWDGAVSNARTYTLNDWDIILKDLQSNDYKWEKGTVKGKGGNKMYLTGRPV